MPEWLIGAVSKTVMGLVPIVGSNPTLSAKETLNFGYNFAVLDGEVAVPCNLQSAIAGMNSRPRIGRCVVCPQ